MATNIKLKCKHHGLRNLHTLCLLRTNIPLHLLDFKIPIFQITIFSANPGSIRSNYDENAPVSYEPGTGAELMHRAGWHNRDAYGNPYRAAEEANAARNVHFGSDMKER